MQTRKKRQCTYERNNKARSCNHYCDGKAIIITRCVFVCSIRYPACNVHALYCDLWPAPSHTKFFHIIPKKRHNFQKKNLLRLRYMFWFPQQILSQTFLILRTNERGTIKKMYIGLRVKYPLFHVWFNETWISSTGFFRKILKYQINENPFSWKRVVPYGWNDRRDEAISRLSQFCERF